MPDASSPDPDVKPQAASLTSVSGGVNIDAQHVSIGGDLVAGGKTVIGYTSEQVSTLLTQISGTFQPKPFDGRCPYLGLDAFTEDDADRFFGRETLVSELCARIKDSRFVVIAGPSGSGKSSLVRAGLIHALKQGTLPNSDRWLYATLTPGRDPIEALALALSRMAQSPDAGDYIRRHAAEADALHKFAESVLSDRKDQRAMIFVDQFEEVFTQVSKEDERVAFLNLLTHAATREKGRVTVLFAMRSDFVSNCAAYPQLNALLNQQFMQVGAMQPDELVSAIARPALQVGLRIDPDLVAQIVNDMQDEPGALPLMQFALKDLFDAQQAKGGMVALTLNDYLARGGLRRALERHADAAFARLNKNEQQLARSIFAGLIEIGSGREDTRRTASFDELVPASAAADPVKAVIQKLADARLITTAEQDHKESVTIAHERLIDAWPWLRKLIDENRESIALQNEIAGDAKEWNDSNRDASYLYSGARLATAREHLAAKKIVLNELAQAFVEAGIQAEQNELEEVKRRAAQLRKWAVYLVGALLIAVAAAAIAVLFGLESQRQARIADEQRGKAEAASQLAAENEKKAIQERDNAIVQQKIANAQRLVAQAQITLKQGNSQQLAMLLALAAQENSPSAESEAVLREGLPRLPFSVGQLPNLGYVNAIAFSPDGSQFATADDNGLQVWDANQGKAVQQLIKNAGVRSVAFSLDGAWLISGEENQARIWDAAGKEIATLPQQAWVTSITVSPDGKWLATAGEDGSVSVWQTANLRAGDTAASATLQHDERVNQLAFSPDSTRLATASEDGTAWLWDVAANREVGRVAHNGPVLSVAFSPDGQRLATGSGDATARVWSLAGSESPGEVLRLVHGDWVEGVAFSPDGQTLATASDDGTARVWNAANGQEVLRLPHQGAVRQVSFSPNGKWIATGSADLTVRLWDTSTGQQVSQMPQPDALTAIGYSPIGSRLVTADASGLAELWNTAAIDQMETARIQQKDWVRDMAFSADGSQVAVASDDGFTAWLWNITGNIPQVIREFKRDNQDFVRAVALSPDGRWLAAASDDKTVWVWVLSTVTDTETSPRRFAHDGEVHTVAFNPDSQLLASGSADETVRLWDVATGEERQKLQLDGAVTSVVFSPDGKQLATSDEAGYFKIWDVATGKEVLSQLTDYLVRDIAFHPDGQSLAIAADRFVYVWDVSSNKEVRHMVHDGEVRSVDFSPDGKLVASTSDDGTTRLWDAANGAELARMFHVGNSLSLAFDPQGDRLAVADGDTAHVWDVKHIRLVQIDQLVNEVCSRLTRNLTRDEWRVYFGDEPYRKTCQSLP